MEDETSKHYVVKEYNCSDFPGYNIMASHLYYNRPAMEEIVQNGKYITIIRSPFARFKSGFYFKRRDTLLPNSSNLFEEHVKRRYDRFLRKGESLKIYLPRFRLLESEDETLLASELQRLDKELDLVMLTEYYDESLVLLRKLMCWQFEDIVYFPMKVHGVYQPPITTDIANMVQEFSADDVKFYEYFNDTFWDKVKNYDGDFSADLTKFRKIQDNVRRRCCNDKESPPCNLLHVDAYQMSLKIEERNEVYIC
ncbi:galactose-3-O-sulfotransferase 3-like [Glandiceps talaboti]